MGKKPARKKRAWTAADEAHRLWMVSGVKLEGKNQKGLAGAIGRSEGTVSKLLAGDRRLALGEKDKIVAYFGSGHPPPNGGAPNATSVAGAVMGEISLPPELNIEAIIAPGFWSKAGGVVSIAAQRMPITGRIDPKYVGMKQYACVLRNDLTQYVVCVPYPAMRASPVHGDKVHVRRTRENGEHEHTIRVVHISGSNVSLVLPDAPDDAEDKVLPYPSQGTSETIELRGYVIGRFIAED